MAKKFDNFLRINGVIFIALNILIIFNYFPTDLGDGYEYYAYDGLTNINKDGKILISDVWFYEYNDRFILALQKDYGIDTVNCKPIADIPVQEGEKIYYWIIDKLEDTIYCHTYYPRFLFLCDSLGTELSLPESPKSASDYL